MTLKKFVFVSKPIKAGACLTEPVFLHYGCLLPLNDRFYRHFHFLTMSIHTFSHSFTRLRLDHYLNIFIFLTQDGIGIKPEDGSTPVLVAMALTQPRIVFGNAVNVQSCTLLYAQMWNFTILKPYFHYKNARQIQIQLDRRVISLWSFVPYQVKREFASQNYQVISVSKFVFLTVFWQ